jgi:hypothetical protein
LGSECPDGFSGLDDATVDLLDVDAEEKSQLQVSDPVEAIPDVVLVALLLDLYTGVVLF